MGFSALAGGIVGSRVYFIVQNYDSVKDDLLGKLFSGSGLVWYGGAIGGALAVLLWARYRGFLGLALLDLCAPALALGYAIGRCGCQLSGDGDYGKAWNGPWAMSYPTAPCPPTRPSTRPRSTRRWRWGSAPGSSGSCATASGPASSSRSTSSTPGPSASWSSSSAATTRVALGLTAAQLESLAMMIAGVVWIYAVKRRHGNLGRPGAPACRRDPQTQTRDREGCRP